MDNLEKANLFQPDEETLPVYEQLLEINNINADTVEKANKAYKAIAPSNLGNLLDADEYKKESEE